MLKSMLARLEFCNSLAPIEDYGRHQAKMANKKKKKKKVLQPMEASGNAVEESAGPKYDDNFYDLDDNFIDDAELEGC